MESGSLTAWTAAYRNICMGRVGGRPWNKNSDFLRQKRKKQNNNNICRADSKDITTCSCSSSVPSTAWPVYWEILAHTQYPSLFRGEICWNELVPLTVAATVFSSHIASYSLSYPLILCFCQFWIFHLNLVSARNTLRYDGISPVSLTFFFYLGLFSLSDWLLEWHRQTGSGPEWKCPVQWQLCDGKPHCRRDDHHGNVTSGRLPRLLLF